MIKRVKTIEASRKPKSKLETPILTPILPPNESEMKNIRDGVSPDCRVEVNLTLRLTPLQARALHFYSLWIGVTYEEYVADALNLSLDGYNTNDETDWNAVVLNGVLDLFPERKKDLQELADAYNAEVQASDARRQASLKMRSLSGRMP